MNYKEMFKRLCTPAQIYLVIAVFASIVGLFSGFPFMLVFWKLLFALVWTYILAWLCKKGFKLLSWFLVLLPYIIMLLAFFKLYRVTESQRSYLRMLQLQGAYGQEPMDTMNQMNPMNPTKNANAKKPVTK